MTRRWRRQVSGTAARRRSAVLLIVTVGAVGCGHDPLHGPCDGFTDDDHDRHFAPASCTSASTQCLCDDCVDNDATVYAGATELCDGKDNNCDALTDEGFRVGRLCGVAGGGCGRNVCGADGAAVCSPTNDLPSPEVCDDQDNDCDVEIDEGFGVGALCSAGEGACLNDGAMRCTADGTGVECSAVATDPAVLCAGKCGGPDNCGGVCLGSCAEGCCDPSAFTCVPFAAQSNALCGDTGAMCDTCVAPAVCEPSLHACFCEPQCAGRCSGDDDQCGSTCTASDCAGCCAGLTCRLGAVCDSEIARFASDFVSLSWEADLDGLAEIPAEDIYGAALYIAGRRIALVDHLLSRKGEQGFVDPQSGVTRTWSGSGCAADVPLDSTLADFHRCTLGLWVGPPAHYLMRSDRSRASIDGDALVNAVAWEERVEGYYCPGNPSYSCASSGAFGLGLTWGDPRRVASANPFWIWASDSYFELNSYYTICGNNDARAAALGGWGESSLVAFSCAPDPTPGPNQGKPSPWAVAIADTVNGFDIARGGDATHPIYLSFGDGPTMKVLIDEAGEGFPTSQTLPAGTKLVTMPATSATHHARAAGNPLLAPMVIHKYAAAGNYTIITAGRVAATGLPELGLLTVTIKANEDAAALCPPLAVFQQACDTPPCEHTSTDPIDLQLAGALNYNTNIRNNRAIRVIIDVVNAGTGWAPSSNLRLYLSRNGTTVDAADDVLATDLVWSDSMPPGASLQMILDGTTPTDLAAGTIVYLIVAADADNTIAESNEANNTWSKALPVVL